MRVAQGQQTVQRVHIEKLVRDVSIQAAGDLLETVVAELTQFDHEDVAPRIDRSDEEGDAGVGHGD